MPAPLRLRPDGPEWPYSLAQLRQDEPQLSISAAPHAGEIASWLELEPPIVYIQPEVTEPPEHDPATHRAVEVQPVCANGVWRQAWQLEELPPPPEPLPVPDWTTFKSVALASSTIAAILGPAYSGAAPQAAGQLPLALEKAQTTGSIDEFAVCWAALLQAVPVAAEELAGLVAVAQACRLPQQFIEALDPAPPGMTRARDEAGRFIADDPTTPQDEAWVASE